MLLVSCHLTNNDGNNDGNIISEEKNMQEEVAHIWVVGEVNSDQRNSVKEDPEDWEDFFGLTVLKSGPPFTHIATLSSIIHADSNSGSGSPSGSGGDVGGGGGGSPSNSTSSNSSSNINNDSGGHMAFDWVCYGLSQKVATNVNELRGSWLSSIHDDNLALW